MWNDPPAPSAPSRLRNPGHWRTRTERQRGRPRSPSRTRSPSGTLPAGITTISGHERHSRNVSTSAGSGACSGAASGGVASPRFTRAVVRLGPRCLLPSMRSPPLPSDHDALDFVARDRVRRPVVELRRLRATRAPRSAARARAPPPVRQVRRDAGRPKRVAARSSPDAPPPLHAALIIASTARRPSGRPLSRPAWPTLWNSGARASSRPPSATYASTALPGPVVRGHVVPLPALLVQPSHPRTPYRK